MCQTKDQVNVDRKTANMKRNNAYMQNYEFKFTVHGRKMKFMLLHNFTEFGVDVSHLSNEWLISTKAYTSNSLKEYLMKKVPRGNCSVEEFGKTFATMNSLDNIILDTQVLLDLNFGLSKYDLFTGMPERLELIITECRLLITLCGTFDKIENRGMYQYTSALSLLMQSKKMIEEEDKDKYDFIYGLLKIKLRRGLVFFKTSVIVYS